MAKIFNEILNQFKIFLDIVNLQNKLSEQIRTIAEILIQTQEPPTINDCVSINCNKHKEVSSNCTCVFLSVLLNCVVLEPIYITRKRPTRYVPVDVCLLIFNKKHDKLCDIRICSDKDFYNYLGGGWLNDLKKFEMLYNNKSIKRADELMDYLGIQLGLNYYDLKDFSKKLKFLNLSLL